MRSLCKATGTNEVNAEGDIMCQLFQAILLWSGNLDGVTYIPSCDIIVSEAGAVLYGGFIWFSPHGATFIAHH